MQSTIRDAYGSPVEGSPVVFSNPTSYGIFSNNNVVSGPDGIA